MCSWSCHTHCSAGTELKDMALFAWINILLTIIHIYCFQVGTSLGATRGLLLRGGDVLEKFAEVDAIVFDKTGTLTIGKPVVTKVVASHSEGGVNTKLSGSYSVYWICMLYLVTFLKVVLGYNIEFSCGCIFVFTSHLIETHCKT